MATLASITRVHVRLCSHRYATHGRRRGWYADERAGQDELRAKLLARQRPGLAGASHRRRHTSLSEKLGLKGNHRAARRARMAAGAHSSDEDEPQAEQDRGSALIQQVRTVLSGLLRALLLAGCAVAAGRRALQSYARHSRSHTGLVTGGRGFDVRRMQVLTEAWKGIQVFEHAVQRGGRLGSSQRWVVVDPYHPGGAALRICKQRPAYAGEHSQHSRRTNSRAERTGQRANARV